MTPLVVLTRPEADSARLAESLSHRGYESLVAPLLCTEPLPSDARPTLPTIDQGDLLIFTSAHAVEHGIEAIRQATMGPAHWLAVGRRTAAALADFGETAARPARSDSEGLLALPETLAVHGRHAVIVKGEDGRTLLGESLRSRGATVIEYNCYRRRYLPLSAPLLAALLAHGEPLVWVATSGGIVEHMEAELRRHGHAELMSQALVVPSARVAAAAEAAGWSKVWAAVDASDDAIGDALDRVVASRQGR